jgi:hypothetical protein
MPRTDRWPERIGAVFLPVADSVEVAEDAAPPAEGPPLPQGCYTLSLRWAGTQRNAPGLVGTLRVEPMLPRVRFSADLYRDQLTPDVLADPSSAHGEGGSPAEEAADTGGSIPIFPRLNYHSYLRGVGAKPSSTLPGGAGNTVVLEFEEFIYTHGEETHGEAFRGEFTQAPSCRPQLRFVVAPTAMPGLYSGTASRTALGGWSRHGTVSIRWVSPHYRHAQVQLHTLEGAVAPPTEVDGATLVTIFADAGWELSVTDGGTFPLPAELSHVNINDCWTADDMKKLLTSVPGFDLAEFDSVWRVHLVAIPTKLGCWRGRMLESVLVHDVWLARLGATTSSHAGYPSDEVPDGMGGSHYDAAADQQQRQVPRAYLRSAAHELGHAFNQIHQADDKGEPDNSIMTSTDDLAKVLGTAGTFPDEVNMAFNDRVKGHLRHLPDPAVRPGAMRTFLTAESLYGAAPEAADVTWLEPLELSVELPSDHLTLGEPTTLFWTLTNRGQTAVSVPTELTVESGVARVSITDPRGMIRFMRPAEVQSCPQVSMAPLEAGASVRGSTDLFGGLDGFAFEMAGRHVVEVIVLWGLAGVLVAVSGTRAVFVFYPTTTEENEVAALLLDPDVGKAVASGDLTPFERAAQRIKRAQEIAPTHPANLALRRLGLNEQPT